MKDVDTELRAAAFAWLDAQCQREGDELPWQTLHTGFDFHGQRVPLIVQQGIHKPRALSAALSITTSLRPKHLRKDEAYDDHFVSDSVLGYRYQGSDPQAWDNRALRRALMDGKPLIYLHQVSESPSRYFVVRPVYAIREDAEARCFYVQHDPPELGVLGDAPAEASFVDSRLADLRRSYATSLVRRRMHQSAFRERVLTAYRNQCAMCRFKFRELLDAAHIDADRHEHGEPVVANGLSLCRLHHGAFDRGLLGIDPRSYRVVVRDDVMAASDGPMLQHGLQALRGQLIELPKLESLRPDPARLARHLERSQIAI